MERNLKSAHNILSHPGMTIQGTEIQWGWCEGKEGEKDISSEIFFFFFTQVNIKSFDCSPSITEKKNQLQQIIFTACDLLVHAQEQHLSPGYYSWSLSI